MTRAHLIGGPYDGESFALVVSRLKPSELRFGDRVHPECWDHAYTLRGTQETGYYYEYIGQRDLDQLHPCDANGQETAPYVRRDRLKGETDG